MTIDREKAQPVFRQIYDILLAEIEAGLYSDTGMLPGEKDLCERFGVERNTVRKALQILVNEDRVIRQRGSGTKIVPAKADQQSEPVTEQDQVQNCCVMLVAREDYVNSGDAESFHYKLIHSLEKRLSEMGCNLLFKTVGKNGSFAESLRNAEPAAIIFDSYIQSSFHREALQLGVPCLSINHDTPLMMSIVSNNFDSAYQVAKVLTDAGHTRIALILGKRSHQTCIERLSGVQSLYMARNLPWQEQYLFAGDWHFRSGLDAAQWLVDMDKDVRPTAVFAFNDDMAYGCYAGLVRQGLSVPGDISIVGFDRSDRFEAMFPPLTTVDVNLGAIIDYACWYLAESLAGKAPRASAKIQIDATLCEHGTIRMINDMPDDIN